MSTSHFFVIVFPLARWVQRQSPTSGLPSEMPPLIGILDHTRWWDHGHRDAEAGNGITSHRQTGRLMGKALGLRCWAFRQRGWSMGRVAGQ